MFEMLMKLALLLVFVQIQKLSDLPLQPIPIFSSFTLQSASKADSAVSMNRARAVRRELRLGFQPIHTAHKKRTDLSSALSIPQDSPVFLLLPSIAFLTASTITLHSAS